MVENFVKLNKDKINHFILELHDLENIDILSGEINYEGISKEKLEELIAEIKEIISDKKDIQLEVNKRKLKEVDNFNKNTLEKLKPYFEDPFTTILGHGTQDKKWADNIIEEGLKAKIPDLRASFIPVEYSNESFNHIKNWTHLQSKYIVLVGFNDNTITPIWKYKKEGEHGQGRNYNLSRKRIIGYIDVSNETFIESPYYEKKQQFELEYNINTNGKLCYTSNNTISENISEIKKLLAIINCYNDLTVRDNIYNSFVIQIKNYISNLEIQKNNLNNNIMTDNFEFYDDWEEDSYDDWEEDNHKTK